MSKLNNQIASWDTKFETGTKTALLQPFSPVVIASDENERIRWENLCTMLPKLLLLNDQLRVHL